MAFVSEAAKRETMDMGPGHESFTIKCQSNKKVKCSSDDVLDANNVLRPLLVLMDKNLA